RGHPRRLSRRLLLGHPGAPGPPARPALPVWHDDPRDALVGIDGDGLAGGTSSERRYDPGRRSGGGELLDARPRPLRERCRTARVRAPAGGWAGDDQARAPSPPPAPP